MSNIQRSREVGDEIDLPLLHRGSMKNGDVGIPVMDDFVPDG
ncbi:MULTISPECIES: hypothetical protein [unclassified Oceanispirochaeta]|nr:MULTISPECIES: hypothetical protein [unclassified Oceanispirochaeta]